MLRVINGIVASLRAFIDVGDYTGSTIRFIVRRTLIASMIFTRFIHMKINEATMRLGLVMSPLVLSVRRVSGRLSEQRAAPHGYMTGVPRGDVCSTSIRSSRVISGVASSGKASITAADWRPARVATSARRARAILTPTSSCRRRPR